jgi:FkbM family methyltransferase
MSKLSVGHYAKNLKLAERNREWWASSYVDPSVKLAYYWYIAFSYLTGAKKVKYLGANLWYDNPATPLNMQVYPYEISRKVIKNMDHPPKTVLDIGANIGQFSLTMNHALRRNVKIDSFEPNPFVYELLKKNVENSSNIRVHNYGIGARNETLQIYYDPRRTGIGSMIKQNAGVGATSSAAAKITCNASNITRRTNYDLVKIDVEGYEFNAIQGLKSIRPKYLFIEISGAGRTKNYKHSRILNLIEKTWGEFDICYMGAYRNGSPTFDLLIRFAI